MPQQETKKPAPTAPTKEKMMTEPFKFISTPAARAAIWLRLFLCGAGGSGKTYSALAIACALAKRLDAGPVHVIDSESGSTLRYAKSPHGKGFDFIHTPMPRGNYHPEMYEAAIAHVLREGARVIVIDSITHEWDGARGCLELVDDAAEAAERSGKKPDNFSAWRKVTPLHRHFLESILSTPAHVFATLRAKTKYESKKEGGRMKFEKAGEGPIQRDGIEYEPDIFGWMADATLTIDKTRCDRVAPGTIFERPGDDVAALLGEWVMDAAPAQASALPQKKLPQIIAEAATSVDLTQEAIDTQEAQLRALMNDKGIPADTQRKALGDFALRVAKRAEEAGIAVGVKQVAA